ncbi:hypothetical protein EVAR_78524_1 [Eumeta japonica]|uniref:Uncharacterized protein n=1 Tax=Eumeta variegata TaxID=151549 RepID=A0A4C1ZUU3_EUMVA|nr:hypothetical protein EVAR_78524_1 [Eumeta japonica]
MDIDPSSAPTSRANDAKPSPAVQQTQTTSTASVESTRNPVSASTQAVTAKTAPRTGAKPTAPPRPKLPPPIFLRKALTSQISADCTRLRINCPSAPPTTALKFTAQTLRLSAVSINISWTSKSNFTHTPSRRRKLKAVIRGIPTDPGRRNPNRPLRPGFALGAQTLPQRRLTIMASSRRPSQDRGSQEYIQ